MKIIEKCIACGKKVPWVCFFGNSTLALFKIAVGFISGSKALIADGLHSGSDVLATVMVIISLKISDKDRDRSHPWGYGKIEYVGSIFVYVILFILGGYIFIDAVVNIITGRLETPHIISLFAALVSIAANVILSSYGFCAGKRLNSPAMIANANENKADMLSSFAVVLGILGAHAGFAFADPLAAIIVAMIILKMSATLFLEALAGLMDKSIDKKAIGYIKDIAFAQKGVRGVSFIRARKLGGKAWVEMEILTDYRSSVTQANAICDEVRAAILRKAMHMKEVVVTFNTDSRVPYNPTGKMPGQGSGRTEPRKGIFSLKRRRVEVTANTATG